MTFTEMFILTGIRDKRRKEKIHNFFDSPENFLWSYDQMEEDLKKTEINRIKTLRSITSKNVYDTLRESKDFIKNPISAVSSVLKRNTELLYKNTEELIIAILDQNYRLIKTVMFESKDPAAVPVEANQIARCLTMCESASGFMSIHNHPSGNVTPSGADEIAWERFNKVASALKMTHFDDIIVGKSLDENVKIYSRAGRDVIEVQL
jgi:DNA repair protein RadC